MLHCMVDIETLDTAFSAVVLSVGAVVFDDDFKPVSQFYAKPDLRQQQAIGRTVSASTVEWWKRQSRLVREEAIGPAGRKDAKEVVWDLTAFLAEVDELWANPPSFDVVILNSLSKDLGIGKEVVHYRKTRDVRTVKALAGMSAHKSHPIMLAHHPIHDCLAQIEDLKTYLSRIKVIG